jgi:hypothetical protein
MTNQKSILATALASVAAIFVGGIFLGKALERARICDGREDGATVEPDPIGF